MSAASIVNKLCTYFGGPYDDATHTYRTPQISVPGLSGPILRRGAPKHDDHASDYYVATPLPVGVTMGCLILVIAEQGTEKRVAVAGAVSGVKHVQHQIKLHCFLRCEVSYAEDAQDIEYALIDAVRAHIEADRTCGSGGFEAGYGVGFQVGEGGEPWLRWRAAPISTTSRELSKGYVLFEFAADEYVQA